MTNVKQFSRPLIHRSGLTMTIAGSELVLEEPWALGGLSEIWTARYGDKKVAAKLINPPADASDKEITHASERLVRGAKMQMRLSKHSSIVTCKAYASGKGRPHIAVYEYIELPTLIERFNQDGKIPGPRRLTLLMRRLCSVLDLLHSNGILHLDLKCDNLFVDSQWHVKLSDFDFAQTIEEGKKNQSWLQGGCPYHAAPERWTNTQPLGPQTDIYSLGVMFWKMLTARYPFHEATKGKTGSAHCRSELPLHKLRERKVSPPMVEVIARMLAKKPEDRFPNVLELKSALREALDE